MASLGHLRAGKGVREAVVKLASQSSGTIKVGFFVFTFPYDVKIVHQVPAATLLYERA